MTAETSEPGNSDAYITPDDVAAKYTKGRQWVLRRCHAGHFPHIKIGNTVRFTEDHLKQIEAKYTVAPAEKPANPYGRKTRRS